MDKTLIRQRFAKAVDTYCRKADVQRSIASEMLALVKHYLPADAHRRVLEVGCGTGMFTRMYLREFNPERMWLNDICPEVESCFSDIIGLDRRFIAGDAENTEFPARLSMMASCSAVQWFEEPERFFWHCCGLLDEGGFFAFTTFGKDNMREVSSITGFSLAYRSLEELSESLSTHYEIVHSSEEIRTMTFATPLEVLKHLKETGVTGIESKRWTRGMLSSFCSRYDELYSDGEGHVALTYHPIYMILKKRKL